MNKEEFIKYLDSKLSYLVDEEKAKELDKYSKVIDNYVSMGQSEADAIGTFGNPDDLVMAIYLSHGLNYKKLYGRNVVENSMKSAIKNFGKKLTGEDKKEMGSSLLYLLYLILLVILIKVAFIFVRDMGETFYSSIFTGKVAYKIYGAVFEVLYIATAIYLFIHLFKKRFSS